MENQILDDNFSNNNGEGQQEVVLLSSNKFLILFFCTLGIYGTWWMYKTWKFFMIKDRLDIMPAARAIFAIFFMYSLFEEIRKFALENSFAASYSSGLLFILFIGLSFVSNINESLGLIGLLGCISFIPPLKAFNEGLRNSDTYYCIENSGFNTRQIVLIVIGALLWVVLLVGIFAPAEF